LYSKHLISVTALFLSTAGCSSTPADELGDDTSGSGGSGAQPGKGGSSGTTGALGGSAGHGGAPAGAGGTAGTLPNNGGGAGKAAGGASGSGAGPGGGSGGSAAGAAPMGGSSGTAGGPSTGGASSGGMAGMPAGGSAGAGAGTGGAAGGSSGSGGSGGSGPPASFKCENLSLAPSTTGVAKPAGAAGGLKVIDWAGFKGAMSMTFDDNTPSQMANYAALKATGGHFTWFVVGSWLSGSSDVAKYKATLADGQEMANHTYNHQSGGSMSDLQQAETFITTNFGVTANSMAAPNCDGSWASVAPSVLFQNRGPCSGSAATVSPRDSTSPFALPAYLPATGEASATMSNSIQMGKWRIFVIHGFDSQGGTYQPVPIANVTGTMTKAVTDGYWVEGISNVGAYWQGQKLISATATTSATWTLPAHFPPNMCVRVTTTGGNVTQKGQSIAWDDHGYYQISLDAGEVTIQ
jgi:hypothetical protein